jgi:hypothetical protein
MDDLGLYDVFAGGLLERVPKLWPEREALLSEARRPRPGRTLSVLE